MTPPDMAETLPVGVRTTAITGVVTFTSSPFRDDRGQFARLFDRGDLAPVHQDRPIVQINHSITREPGTIRGMHFQQAPYLEAKWVRCLRGRVLDVAVDLRRGSPTFLRHIAVELDPQAMTALFIPEGCAHGFQVLEPDSELLYLHTAAYAPQAEGGVRWDDPRLGIAWPLPPTGISARDGGHALLSADYQGIEA